MSLARVFSLIARESRLGIRNPMFLFAIIIPIVFTVIIQLIFGGFWTQEPAMAVYDRTGGVIVSELEKSKAITLVTVDSEDELVDLVEAKRVDAGIVFPEDLRQALQEGDTIRLKTYIDGETYASDRAVIAAAAFSAIRSIDPGTPVVEFEQVQIGQERAVSLLELMIPFLVLIAVLYSAFLLPATFLVREKERKTITALLVTPTSTTEMLTAYGLLGSLLAVLMGIVVLVLNGVWTQPLLMTLFLVLGSVFMVELGLIAGLYFNDMNNLFANIKLFGIVIWGPAIFIFFPSWPQWIAQLFPTYYLMHPVFRISIYGDGFAEVGWEALVLLGIIAVFIVPLVMLAKRLGKQG